MTELRKAISMNTLFDASALQAGHHLVGKWNGIRYRIHGLIGEGANGRVYLVSKGNLRFALKMGFDAVDLANEVNALRQLRSGFLVDADDWETSEGIIPFYVMTFVNGNNIRQYMKKHGADWFYVLGAGLLRKLQELHAKGYCFGDLKYENVLVSGFGEVDLIDYGGVSEFGRSVKQFTELYDRGYWNAGSRKADSTYDLFSFAVLMIQLLDQEGRLRNASSVLPQHRSPEYLIEMAESIPACVPVLPVLKKAIQGKYTSSTAALDEWRGNMKGGTAQRTRRSSTMWVSGLFLVSAAIFSALLVMAVN